MSPIKHNWVPWIATAVLFLVCLVLVAVFAFAQGKAAAERRAQIQVANDDAYLALSGLQALKEPQNEQWRSIFQVNLDGGAIKLSEMSLTHPELIGSMNYNLLIHIQKYLRQYGHDPDRSPGLPPVDQVTAKIAEATAKLESIHHDVRQWEQDEQEK
jgi:hypothetical protein